MDAAGWSSIVQKLSEGIVDMTPAVLISVGLLLFGWAVAHSCRFVAKRTLGRIADRIDDRFGSSTALLRGWRLWRAAPRALGEGVFWVVLAFFSAVALEQLQVPMVAEAAHDLAYFLPKVLLSALIVFVGIGVGSLAHHRISALLQSAGFERSEILGRLVQGGIVVVATLIGAQQVGLETGVFTTLGTVAVGATVGGMALAFGLGSVPVVANIMASYYASKALQVGTVIRVGDITGTIQEITATTIVLDANGDQVHIPAKKYSEEGCVLVRQDR